MKYFILAGEKSGDLHGSNLVKSIFEQDTNAIIQAWGGESMEEEGAKILLHYSELSIMGIIGVLQNLVKLKKLFNRFREQIKEFNPDTIIFIDFGGFNLKAAKIAKELGFHTQFYIAPKVWAWNYSRIYTIKKWIDELYVIFPFEKQIFENEGISTHYEGNPLMDEIATFKIDKDFVENNQLQEPYIALLPGSRKQELNYLLPVFKELIKTNPSYHFVLAGIESFKKDYEQLSIPVIYNQTYQLISNARLAVVCSGTATLETALLHTPLILVYKTDKLFYFLAKTFVKLKYISLVNIILDRLAIPELIQENLNSNTILQEIQKIFDSTQDDRIQQLEEFKKLQILVGDKGASNRVARIMIEKASNFSNNS